MYIFVLQGCMDDDELVRLLNSGGLGPDEDEDDQ